MGRFSFSKDQYEALDRAYRKAGLHETDEHIRKLEADVHLFESRFKDVPRARVASSARALSFAVQMTLDALLELSEVEMLTLHREISLRLEEEDASKTKRHLATTIEALINLYEAALDVCEGASREMYVGKRPEDARFRRLCRAVAEHWEAATKVPLTEVSTDAMHNHPLYVVLRAAGFTFLLEEMNELIVFLNTGATPGGSECTGNVVPLH